MASKTKEEQIRENEKIAIAKMAQAQAKHERAVYASASGMEADVRKASVAVGASKLGVAPDDQTVVHSGYLIKAPPTSGKLSMKGWKSRFFVLRKRSAVLQYYASKEAFKKGDLPKGIIDLTLCEHPHTRSNKGATFEKQKQVSKKYSNIITLTSPRRVYHFSAPSVVEAMRWVKLIGDVQERIKTSGLAPYSYGAAAPAPVLAGGGDADELSEDEDEDDEEDEDAPPPVSNGGAPRTPAPVAQSPTSRSHGAAPPRGATSPKSEPRAAAPLPPPGTFTGVPPVKMDRTHESRPWFFGPMDRTEADETLREAAASDGSGLFIVRSSEHTGGFVMSWIGGTNGKVTHTQVLELPSGMFKFKSKHGPPSQPTLTKLIECKEFVAMLRRADDSFRKTCSEDEPEEAQPTTQKKVSLAVPEYKPDSSNDSSSVRTRTESFYVTHTPRDKRRRRPTTAASDAAVQLRKMQKENERLRQELQAAREFLAAQAAPESGGDDGDDGDDFVPPPPPPPPPADDEFQIASIHKQDSQRKTPSSTKSGAPLITAPLREQDLVTQLLLQQELRKKLEETYTRISQNSGDFVEPDEDI
eukprot:m.49087 g.49087  ORF g.49087 m.49087 type:complete len:585 (+) comp8941_c0_seq2:627-2381(+)